jgi:hypothetical protein
MKNKENTIKKYMNFLGWLYIALEEEQNFNMNNACIIHKINKRFPSVLKKRGILINENKSMWMWNKSYTPNKKMIDSVLKEISSLNAEQKRGKPQGKSKSINGVRKQTNEKYMNFIHFLKLNSDSNRKMPYVKLCEQFMVHRNSFSVLARLGYLDKKGAGFWKWLDYDSETQNIALDLIANCQSIAYKEHRKKEFKSLDKSELLEMKEEGMSNVDIANDYGVTEGTLRYHLNKFDNNKLRDKKEIVRPIKKISFLWGIFNYEKS